LGLRRAGLAFAVLRLRALAGLRLAIAAAWRLAGFAAASRLAGFAVRLLATGYGRPVSNVPARTLSPEYHIARQKM
jgi:hypothetical protein